MATTTNLLSWEAFEQLPDGWVHHEIIEGELIALPPPTAGCSIVAWRAANALRILETGRMGRVFTEAGYKLSHDPPTWIQPDVSFIVDERVKATDPDDYFHGAPELAVEVISASETAADVDRKVGLLLAHGSKAVWLIYQRTSKVQVHFTNGTGLSRGIGENLSLPELLPGWELPVAKLFE